MLFSLAGGAVSYVMVNGAPGFLQKLTEEEKTAPAVPAPSETEEAPPAEVTWRVPLGEILSGFAGDGPDPAGQG